MIDDLADNELVKIAAQIGETFSIDPILVLGGSKDELMIRAAAMQVIGNMQQARENNKNGKSGGY